MKKVALLLAVIMAALTLVGCSSGFMSDREMLKLTKNPEVSVTLSYTDSDNIQKEFTLVYELHYEKAPITVTNFVNLVQEGFYNGSVISGGSVSSSPRETNSFYYISGGSYKLAEGENKLDVLSKDYYIKGEFKANQWMVDDETPLKHELGNLVMSRTSGVSGFDTASTAWYICMSTWAKNDGNYAVFGTLKSMSGKIYKTGENDEKVVDLEIPAQTSMISVFYTDMMGLSTSSQSMKTTEEKSTTVKIPNITITVNMTVDTFGVTFPQAKTVKK